MIVAVVNQCRDTHCNMNSYETLGVCKSVLVYLGVPLVAALSLAYVALFLLKQCAMYSSVSMLDLCDIQDKRSDQWGWVIRS